QEVQYDPWSCFHPLVIARGAGAESLCRTDESSVSIRRHEETTCNQKTGYTCGCAVSESVAARRRSRHAGFAQQMGGPCSSRRSSTAHHCGCCPFFSPLHCTRLHTA